jgi:hypothetical protein
MLFVHVQAFSLQQLKFIATRQEALSRLMLSWSRHIPICIVLSLYAGWYKYQNCDLFLNFNGVMFSSNLYCNGVTSILEWNAISSRSVTVSD